MEYFEQQIRGRCAWLWIGGNSNTEIGVDLSVLLEELEEVWEEIEGNEAVEAVVLSSRSKHFVLDVDLRFFLEMRKLGEWERYGREMQRILLKIEECPKPTLAAIGGDCKGLGLELALACDYRLAVAEMDTCYSLPMVKLGLIPIGGGSQRLPRLIGVRKGLELLVSGSGINVYKAEELGLVDKLAHGHQLNLVAQQQVLELVGKRIVRSSKVSTWDKWMESTTLGRSMMMDEARQKVHLRTHGNYPAPLKIIDCVEMGYRYGVRAGYELEVRSMDEMVTHPISKQLLHTFLVVKAKQRNPLEGYAKEVGTIGIIGAGKMGQGIAQESLLKGFEVRLHDLSEQTLAQAQSHIWSYLAGLAEGRLLTAKKWVELMTNLQTVTHFGRFQNVDVVLESVFEHLDLKQQVLVECMEQLSANSIYAVNTTALAIGDIAQNAKDASRIIGMCYLPPILQSDLVEIIVTKNTAKWVIATAIELGIRQGKTPIVVKDTPGFYTTRILAVLLNEALLLLEEGGDILQVDEATKQLGFLKGVFELIDEIGIDVGAQMMSGQLLQFFRRRHIDRKISMGLLEMYDAGYRGAKNLNGFYSYHSKTGKRRVGVVDEDVYDFFGGIEKERIYFRTKLIRQRLMMAVINEAAYCLQEETLFSPEDGDIGAVLGLGFPAFRGGPFRYLDGLGIDKAVRRLEKLREGFGVRFTPAPIIKGMADRGENFYEL